MALPRALLICRRFGTRHLHHSRIISNQMVGYARFPYLKDKTAVIKAFHKDKNLPFNVMRDVLNIPLVDPESLDATSFAWLEYSTMDDEQILKDQIAQETPDQFWLKTLRAAISDNHLLLKIVTLFKSKKLDGLLDVSYSMEEKLVASLLYVGKYHEAHAVFKDIIYHKKEVDYLPILDVCLCMEDSAPMKKFYEIYCEIQERQLYHKIIPHLWNLNLNVNYIHKWNNILVSSGDFPKQSSRPMNPVFKSMVETKNFRSFDNCLKSIARQLGKSHNWVDRESSKYISELIFTSPNQRGKLESLVYLFGVTSFPKEFYMGYFAKTNIDVSFLDSLLSKIGINKENQQFQEAHVKRLSKGDPNQFWNYVQGKTDQIQSPQALLKMLAMHLRDSRSTSKSIEFAIHILDNHPRYRYAVLNTVIMESLDKDDPDAFSLILHLENFFIDNNLFDDRVQNLLIYADLRAYHIGSALERINSLLSNPESFIDGSTIKNTQLILSRRSRRIPEEFLEPGESPHHLIIKTVLRMHKHNKDVTMETWNGLLLQMTKNFTNSAFEQFCMEVLDHISSSSNVNINPASFSHPLRQVFDDKLVAQIVINGFHQSDAPWCGVETLLKLQSRGVFINQQVVKKQLIKILNLAGMTGLDRRNLQKKNDDMMIPATNLSYEVIVDKINELQKGIAV